jgi:hypothetical protein
MFDSLVEKSFVPGSLNISWIKGAIPQDSKKSDATQLNAWQGICEMLAIEIIGVIIMEPSSPKIRSQLHLCLHVP